MHPRALVRALHAPRAVPPLPCRYLPLPLCRPCSLAQLAAHTRSPVFTALGACGTGWPQEQDQGPKNKTQGPNNTPPYAPSTERRPARSGGDKSHESACPKPSPAHASLPHHPTRDKHDPCRHARIITCKQRRHAGHTPLVLEDGRQERHRQPPCMGHSPVVRSHP